MSTPRKILFGVLALGIAVLVAGFALFTFRDEGPEALEIGDRATTTTVEAATDDDDADTEPETTTTAAPASDGTEGTWTVSGDSLAGYRVVEDFASGLSDFEAVGRTSDVTGSLTIEGTQVTAASFSVVVESIVSDDSRRDNQFSGPIMNADEFPTADFALTEAIDLGSIPADGETITVDASGELTLRGVTQPVTFPLTARLNGAEIEMAGAIDVLFSDYGIDNPSNNFISVRDEGLVEVSLIFQR